MVLAVLERGYCLSWVLVGLSQSPLKDRLAFKGGAALKKCYYEDYRFLEDLAGAGALTSTKRPTGVCSYYAKYR